MKEPGRAGSGRAAAWQVKQAIGTARACGPCGTIMLRGDSAFGTKKVITTCLAEGVEFSLSVSRNKRITAAIATILTEGARTGRLRADVEAQDVTTLLLGVFFSTAAGDTPGQTGRLLDLVVDALRPHSG